MPQTIPGQTGFVVGRYSSMDKRVIGKFTDANHLESLHAEEPAAYDKAVIQIYTQSSLYANDFLAMINQAEPFYIRGVSDSWKWKIELPYQFPKIVDVPADTINQAKIGIDGHSFQFVLDRAEFYIHQVITADKNRGQNFYILADPTPWNGYWLYTAILVSENPKVETVNRQYLQVGMEYQLVTELVGEFDQDLPGLGGSGDYMEMMESLGAANGVEHTITGWADDKMLKDPKTGNPLDLIVYAKEGRNQMGKLTSADVRWEPYVEAKLRQHMLDIKTSKMIWNKPGAVRTRGAKQEVKKSSAGLIHRMRTNGNLVQYPRGNFNINIFRTVFGDLFYRRVDVAQRRVKIYTNEAGFELWETALRDEAFASGLTFNVGDNDKFVQGSGRNLVMNFAFTAAVTRETGRMDLIHLKELDLPQTSLEFGQNKKSAPMFLVFDVSPTGNGTLGSNIREVRLESRPGMTWGYIDGRRHHLGFAASKGHTASSKFDGYTMFFDDRYDVFIEDLSRTVLIEETPFY